MGPVPAQRPRPQAPRSPLRLQTQHPPAARSGPARSRPATFSPLPAAAELPPGGPKRRPPPPSPQRPLAARRSRAGRRGAARSCGCAYGAAGPASLCRRAGGKDGATAALLQGLLHCPSLAVTVYDTHLKKQNKTKHFYYGKKKV